MSSKHFSNDPAALVAGALRALPRINPSVAIDATQKVVYIRQAKSSQVSVISGGGSGHEPSFGSLVGHGFLSGVVIGSIFASPSAEQIQHCLLECVDSLKGILIIIMNYTGDVMHFGMALEHAKARGVEVDMLVVGDDVGVGRARSGRVGRRGIAGTVLVQKVAGAAAATGASLLEVSGVARLVSSNLVSVGASLSHVHVPGRSALAGDLRESNEVEIGMGIHNEEGPKRVPNNLTDVIQGMLAQLLDTTDSDRAYIDIKSSDAVVLLINNLGGLSVLEISYIAEEVCSHLLSGYSLKPLRIYVGTFMSSLNGLGFSISLLRVVDTGLGPGKSMVELLDAPADVSGWCSPLQAVPAVSPSEAQRQVSRQTIPKSKTSKLLLDGEQFTKVLKSGLEALVSAEPEITKFDTMVGDGDCGLCLKNGAQAIILEMEREKSWDNAVEALSRIAQVVGSNMDGTSGAIYGIFLNSLTRSLSDRAPLDQTILTPSLWAEALEDALESLSKYTPARPGDRTLIDALDPFVKTMVKTQDFSRAVAAAKEGCETTKGMRASLGRSVYVGGDSWKFCPDPGAYGLVSLLSGMQIVS